MISPADINPRFLGRLFTYVYDSTTPLSLPNGRRDILHHSSNIGGTHLAANRFDGQDPKLFSSRRSTLNWQVVFKDLVPMREIISDTIPVSSGKTLFFRGLPTRGSHMWYIRDFKSIEFKIYEPDSFADDWLRLRLFENMWGANAMPTVSQ